MDAAASLMWAWNETVERTIRAVLDTGQVHWRDDRLYLAYQEGRPMDVEVRCGPETPLGEVDANPVLARVWVEWPELGSGGYVVRVRSEITASPASPRPPR